MEKRLLAGVDVGTSGAKCIIADEDGRVLASSTQEYPLSTPKPGWAEPRIRRTGGTVWRAACAKSRRRWTFHGWSDFRCPDKCTGWWRWIRMIG